jgi:hypothetical protein
MKTSVLYARLLTFVPAKIFPFGSVRRFNRRLGRHPCAPRIGVHLAGELSLVCFTVPFRTTKPNKKLG